MKNLKMLLAIIILILIIIIIAGVGYLGYYKISTPNKIEHQNSIEKSWNKELSGGDYTIDNPMIVQNPYDSNELAAYVGFNYDEPVSYEYTVGGDIPFTYGNDEETDQVIIPVVALYNDTVNDVDVKLYSKGKEVDSTTFEIDTTETSIRDELNTTDIEKNNESELDEFMDGKFIIDNYTNIYDADGNLRAYSIAPDSDYAYLKVIDNQFIVPDRTVDGAVFRNILFSYSIMGRINPDVYFEGPKGTKFHHDIAKAGDKLYALTSSISDKSDFTDSYKESLISVYSADGTLEDVINMTDFYDVEDPDTVNEGSNAGDMHLNSLDYYEKENLLIIDSRSYSQIVGYNLGTDEVEWIIDDPDTIGSDHKDLLLTPEGDMQYPSGEHTVFIADDYVSDDIKKDGMLYLSTFDNRQCIGSDEKEFQKDISEDPNFELCAEGDQFNSRGLVYEVNLEDRTVSTVEEIEFNSRSTFKGGFNMLGGGYKTTYVANANKFEIYNPEDELIGTYTIHTTEKVTEDDVATLTTEELEYEEDIEEEFFYRAVVATTEEMQSFVEINN